MKLQEERMTIFISAMTKGAHVTDAAKAAGINRKTAYRWREKYPAFGLKWDKAVEEHDRARHHFNTLLLAMLVALRPEVYGGDPKYDALARKFYPEVVDETAWYQEEFGVEEDRCYHS